MLGPSDAKLPSDAFNALFAGTSVVSGEATHAGGRNRTQDPLRQHRSGACVERSAERSRERGVHRLGLLILRLTSFLVLFVLLVHLGLGRPALELFLFALALAVGLTPELLPMVMTVTLVARCHPHGREAPGDREAARGHPRSRCSWMLLLHRQDRHPDRGAHCADRSPVRRRHRQ